MIEIKPAKKFYEWGGYSFISMLLNEKPDGRTYSEIWFGDHPEGSSKLIDGSLLSDWIKSDFKNRIGVNCFSKNNERLSYLLKILDVRLPLSIQIHPSKKQAIKGYIDEIKNNVPKELRNYKDDNHKPELVYALSDFYLLTGFQNKEIAKKNLQRFECLKNLYEIYSLHSIKDFIRYIFSIDKKEISKYITPIINYSIKEFSCSKLSKFDPLYWINKAVSNKTNKNIESDPGIILILLMNLVYLPKGKAVFQEADLPHCYLEGKALELMANSDNVIRCGLTKKHIDIKELLHIGNFEPHNPNFIIPEKYNNNELDYNVPYKDFRLRVFKLKKNEELKISLEESSSILLIYVGEIFFVSKGIFKTAFSSFYICPKETIYLSSMTESILFLASLG